MNSGGHTGGWTSRRLTAVAMLSFGGGLLLMLLLASTGPMPVVVVLGALAAGWVAVSASRRAEAAPTVRALPPARALRAAPAVPSPLPSIPPAEPPSPVRIAPPGPDLEVATVVAGAAELAAMLERKPPCWRYAAFVSVMVQRRAAVASRLRDAGMGFAAPSGEVVETEPEAGLFFTDRLAELSDVIAQLDLLLISTAFQEVFGTDEASADAEGIVGSANRLMDHHDRALALCERCRGAEVPPSCRDLQRDMGVLTALPLEGVHRFIADLTDRVDEAGDVARYATGNIQLDPVELSVTDDSGLLETVSARLQRIARCA